MAIPKKQLCRSSSLDEARLKLAAASSYVGDKLDAKLRMLMDDEGNPPEIDSDDVPVTPAPPPRRASPSFPDEPPTMPELRRRVAT